MPNGVEPLEAVFDPKMLKGSIVLLTGVDEFSEANYQFAQMNDVWIVEILHPESKPALEQDELVNLIEERKDKLVSLFEDRGRTVENSLSDGPRFKQNRLWQLQYFIDSWSRCTRPLQLGFSHSYKTHWVGGRRVGFELREDGTFFDFHEVYANLKVGENEVSRANKYLTILKERKLTSDDWSVFESLKDIQNRASSLNAQVIQHLKAIAFENSSLFNQRRAWAILLLSQIGARMTHNGMYETLEHLLKDILWHEQKADKQTSEWWLIGRPQVDGRSDKEEAGKLAVLFGQEYEDRAVALNILRAMNQREVSLLDETLCYESHEKRLRGLENAVIRCESLLGIVEKLKDHREGARSGALKFQLLQEHQAILGTLAQINAFCARAYGRSCPDEKKAHQGYLLKLALSYAEKNLLYARNGHDGRERRNENFLIRGNNYYLLVLLSKKLLGIGLNVFLDPEALLKENCEIIRKNDPNTFGINNSEDNRSVDGNTAYTLYFYLSWSVFYADHRAISEFKPIVVYFLKHYSDIFTDPDSTIEKLIEPREHHYPVHLAYALASVSDCYKALVNENGVKFVCEYFRLVPSSIIGRVIGARAALVLAQSKFKDLPAVKLLCDGEHLDLKEEEYLKRIAEIPY